MAVQTTPRRLPEFKRPGMNPILIKELRSRMRGPRAFLILTSFLLLLSLVAFFLYKTMETMAQFGGGPVSVSASIGLTMFLGLAFFELFLVSFITPALTAGTISGEREALTYEMLMATPLRPTSILLGKMVAALSYVFLLIFAAVPMVSLVFIFGGVTVQDMGAALLVLAVTAITFGTIGLFWSALLGRTGRATVMSYMTLLAFVIGPYMISTFWALLTRQTPPPGLMYPSPFTAMASVVEMAPDQGFGSPFLYLINMLAMGAGNMQGMGVTLNHPAWHWSLTLYSFITVILLFATILLVRPVGRRRVSVPQALLAIVILGGMVGATAAVFSIDEWQQILRTPDRAAPGVKGAVEPDLALLIQPVASEAVRVVRVQESRAMAEAGRPGPTAFH